MATHAGTISKRLQRALIAIVEHPDTSWKQKLDAAAILAELKGLIPKRKAYGPKRKVNPLSILGNGTTGPES